MFSFWLMLVLLALGWFPLTAIYAPSNIHYQTPYWFSALAWAGALVCGVWSAKAFAFDSTRRQLVWWLLPLLVAIALLPFPYQLPAAFLLLAVLLAVIFKKRAAMPASLIARVTTASFLFGAMLALQTAILPLFYLFASRFHRLEALAPVFSSVFQIFGVQTSQAQGNLFLQSADHVFSFLPSSEALGLYPMLSILLGGWLLFYLLQMRRVYYLLLPLALFGYMLVRYLFLLATFLEVGQANVFWRLEVLTLSLLPLPWFLAKAFALPPAESTPAFSFAVLLREKRARQLAFAVCVLSVATTGFFGFVDPGERKAGRILIDEKHSDWEWTTQEFNTTWFGEKSTYNYYSLAKYLQYFYHVERNFEALTAERLQSCDILFIKPPTMPFAPQEIAAIRDFVANGGSLLLVGDHTNVFGSTTHLNPLAEQFGFKFRYNGQYDLEGELSIYRKPKVLPHPVAQALPPFLFATGCMLEAPLFSENAIIGHGIKSLYLDYSQKNFFPKDARNNETAEFGLFVQAAGKAFGKGRVFLFTDSTVWSNFYMFIPGKPELLLGIMEWLNRRNSLLGMLRWLFLILAFTSAMITFVISRKLAPLRVAGLLLFAGLLTTPLATHAFAWLNQRHYALPQPHSQFVRVNFETEHSHFELPLLHVTQQVEHSFHTFYVGLQRLGFVPALKTDYESALAEGDAVALVNPHKLFDESELQATASFLRKGGKLLLLDDPRHGQHHVANQLLTRFGLQMAASQTATSAVHLFKTLRDTLRIASLYAGEVHGGESLLFGRARAASSPSSAALIAETSSLQITRIELDSSAQKENLNMPSQALPSAMPSIDTTAARPVLARKKFGKGTLAVMATSFLFTDHEMGFTTTQPNANRRRIHELEFWLFQEVLGMEKRGRPSNRLAR